MIHRDPRPVRHRVHFPMAVAALLLLAGCISVGQPFPHAAVSLIKPGTTTMDEVKKIFGNPMRVGTEDGRVTWTYLTYNANILGKAEGRDLLIKFDDQNRVLSFNYNTTDTTEQVWKKS
ncbi:MAG: outer membrane protein assembly factor BamE [Candidatus Lambdaproteobacteria bacterium]|nr:outer membrane protein assembly factor BamE [Candidatus Lambdaproteobacteria bacterium]